VAVSDGDGRQGWTAMPRTAVWLCVPALLMAAGATTILAGDLILAKGTIGHSTMRQAGAAVAIVWTFPALALTPIAGILTLLISRKGKWAPSVVAVLWIVVAVSIGTFVPASNLALRNFVYPQPRPAEAPPARLSLRKTWRPASRRLKTLLAPMQRRPRAASGSSATRPPRAGH